MSQNRRFLFWEGLHDQMMMLDDGRAGAYIKGISRYAFEGVEPDFGGDEMLVFAWKSMADQIRKSVDIGVRSSEAGKRGGGRPTAEKKDAEKGVSDTPEKGVKKGLKKGAEKGVKKGAENDRTGKDRTVYDRTILSSAESAASGGALSASEKLVEFRVPLSAEEMEAAIAQEMAEWDGASDAAAAAE